MMKKLAGIIAVVFALLIGAFLALGFVFPSITYQTKVEINKPVDGAWTYFTDEKNMKDWLPGFKSIKSLNGKTNEVGAKHEVVFVDGQEELIFTQTMTAFKPNETFSFKLESEMFENDVTVSFTETNGKTTLVQSEKVVGRSILWRSMLPLMRFYFSGAAQTTLDKLKDNIEKAA